MDIAKSRVNELRRAVFRLLPASTQRSKRLWFDIRAQVLSTFSRGGRSRRMSWRHSLEIYRVRRKLGVSVLGSVIRALATPVFRTALEIALGHRNLSRWLTRLFGFYCFP
jgi:hypothetical protein